MGERGACETQNDERRPAISCPPSLTQSYPWLVIFDGDNSSRQAFYSISQNHCYVRNIPEMENKLIVSSQQGWLFLEDNVSGDCSLFNMFTLENLQLPQQLPPQDPIYGSHHVVLSSCMKIDESCHILIIRGNLIKFRSFNLGDSEFIEQNLSYDTYRNIGAVANYEGKLYGLSFPGYDLLVADFADPELGFTPVIRGDKLLKQVLTITRYTKVYLVESCGELLFIYTNYYVNGNLDIRIYEANFDMKKWMEVNCLGDRALFLDDYKCLSSPAYGLRRNCVYYVYSKRATKDMNLYAANGDRNLYLANSRDKSVYVYDMKDGIGTSLPYPIVSNEYSSMSWAM